MGLTPAQLAGLAAYDTSEAYTEVERAVIRYAEEMTKQVAASEPAFQAVRAHLGEPEIVELTMTVALANFTNRINDSLRTDLEH